MFSIRKAFDTRTDSFRYLFLFMTVFLVRFPFFFKDVIDWDESTFILMGKSVADGHLPYDHLWDLKPPLLFYLFGLVEKIVPESLIAIRFFGVLVIFISAILILKISKLGNFKNGMLAAMLYILFASNYKSELQGVMSEHVSVLFLLSGLAFFLRSKNSFELLLAGVGFGCAMLCKLSYAYAVLAFLFYYIFWLKKKSLRGWQIKKPSLIVTGICLSFLAVAFPYLIQGKISLFIKSVFFASFEYSRHNNLSFINKLQGIQMVIIGCIAISSLAIVSAVNEQKRFMYMNISLLIGTVYTFFSMGFYYNHYLIQIFPFIFLLVAGVIIKKELNPGYLKLILLTCLICFQSFVEYYNVSVHYIKTSTLYNGKSFELAKEITRRSFQEKRILFTKYHLTYWLLDKYPLTKSTTHPSNIQRSFLFKCWNNRRNNSLDEIKYILDTLKTELVISGDSAIEFLPGSPEALYAKEYLIRNFWQILKDRDNEYIMWQRRH